MAKKGDEGRDGRRYASGRCLITVISEDFRMGKPLYFGRDSRLDFESAPWEVKHFSTRRKRDKYEFRK